MHQKSILLISGFGQFMFCYCRKIQSVFFVCFFFSSPYAAKLLLDAKGCNLVIHKSNLMDCFPLCCLFVFCFFDFNPKLFILKFENHLAFQKNKVLFISTACRNKINLNKISCSLFAPTGGLLGGRHQARHHGQGSHFGQLYAGQRQRVASQQRLLPVGGRLQHGRARPAISAHQRHDQGTA